MDLDIIGIFGAGTLTLLTPCVLPLIPIYLAMLVGPVSDGSLEMSKVSRLRLFFHTAMFSLGMIVVFVALGLTATSLGSLLTEYRTELVLMGGLLVFLFGLKFLGVLQLAALEREKRFSEGRLQTRFHLVNALIMGMVFSLGWTPCVGPILGSVLTYTASATSDPLRGAIYLGIYGLGFALPLLVLSLFADGARRIVGRLSGWLPKLERLSGALLVGMGLYMMLGVSRAPAAEQSPVASTRAMAPIEPPLGQPSTRPRMVQFTSHSCSICRQMIPTVALIERDCGGRNVDVIKVDVSAKQSQALARDFRVRAVPTFVFLDQKGGEAARLVGYQKLGNLRQALAAMVGEQCRGLGIYQPESPTCERAQKNPLLEQKDTSSMLSRKEGKTCTR